MKLNLLLGVLPLCCALHSMGQTADLLNVKFEKGGDIVDQSGYGLPITVPSTKPTTQYDSSINQYVSAFSGSGSNTSTFYKVGYLNNEDFKSKLQSAFTIEIYLKSESTADMCPFSAQQTKGFGVEQASSGGSMQLWYNTSSSQYKVGASSIYSSTNPTYKHVVYTYDGSTVKAYYDATLNGTQSAAALAFPTSTNAHWIAIGGDAYTDTTVAQYGFNGKIAWVKMYSSALTESQVQSKFSSLQTRLNLLNADSLNTIISSKLPAYIGFTTDATKKAQAQSLLTQGWDLMLSENTTDADIQNYFSSITSQLGSLEPETSTLPNVAIISDTHIGNGKGWNVKLNRTIDELLAQSPKLDAVFINGDVTDWGYQSQYDDAKSMFSRLSAQVPVYYDMGNHDWYDDASACDDRFISAFGGKLNQFIDIKGYPFIMLSMESSSQSSAYSSSAVQKFLTDTLAYAAAHYPNKPIFLLVHVPLNGTVYGSYTIGGSDNWGQSNIYNICKNYPQLVIFSGHSHYPLVDERSIHQNDFTSINDGSQTYSEIETGMSEGIHPPGYDQVTEGCFVTIQDNQDVKIKRWDFTNNTDIKTPWTVKYPFTTSNFEYLNRTGGSAPYFENEEQVSVSDITENGCSINFPQGNDDDLVHHYIVEVVDENNNVLTSPKYTVFSRYFLNVNIPTTLSWTLGGLQNKTQYKIKVTAVDSYNNTSSPAIYSAAFTTLEHVIPDSVTAPKADLLDVRFQSGNNAVDSSMTKFPVQKFGSTSTLYDPTTKQYLSRWSGNASNYYKVDYKDSTTFKTTLKAGFTMEAYMKVQTSSETDPFSGLESGGIGMEQVSGGGNMRLWFRDGSSYTQVGNQSIYSATDPQYYHVVFTFDGSKIKAYYNAAPADSTTISSGLSYASSTSAQWFGIGGDAYTGSTVQGKFTGDIAIARLYSRALSRDEIGRLYEQITNRAALSKVEALNTAINETLPGKLTSDPAASDKWNSLLAEGWGLMGDLSTTDAEIQAFLDKITESTTPVSLTNFTATVTKKPSVLLQWKNFAESNVKFYNILRSEDNGNTWISISEVLPKGTGSTYCYEDQNLSNGTILYKIQENSLDDKIEFSDIKAVSLSLTADIKVYPNPSKGIVHITGKKILQNQLQVYDISGKKIPVSIVTTTNGADVDFGNVSTGTYLIKLEEKSVKVNIIK